MTVAYLGYKVDSSQVALAEKRLDKMSGAAAVAGRAAGLLTAAFGAAFAGGAIVRELSEFETSMSSVAAVTRATAGDLEAMRDVAMALGSSTEFSAAQAADGLRFLGMAGFDASEAMAAIPAVLDLATASSMDLASAADIASNVMSGFGIEAGHSADVADVLAAASSRANTDVAQLGSAMSTAAPIASALGIELQDTAAAIGVMSDAGIQGERAGTALRGILASLSGPTAQAADALAKYGLSVGDVNPEVHSLADIMQTLSVRGISTADAMTIFGREAASGALVMIDANERLRDFGDELRNVDGAAGDMASTMRDNLGGDISSLKSAVSGLILAFGDAGLTGSIRTVVQSITSFTQGFVAAVNAVGDFRGYAISAAVAITTIYAPAIYSAVAATGAWIASLITLRGALIATGIGAFVVAGGMAINALLKLVEATGGWGNALVALRDLADQVWDKVLAGGQYLKASLDLVFNDIQYAFALATGSMAVSWGRLVDGIADSKMGEVIGMEGGNAERAMQSMADRQKELTDAMVEIYETQANAKDRMNVPITALAAFANATEVATGETVDLENSIQTLATSSVAAADALGSGGAAGAAAELADTLQSKTTSAVESVADAFGDFVVGGFKDFKSFAASVMNTFKNMLSDMIAMAAKNRILFNLGFASSPTSALAGSGSGGMLSGFGGFAGDALSGIWSGVSSTVTGFTAAMGQGAGLMGSIGSGLTNMMGSISGGIGAGGVGGFASAFGAALPVLGLLAGAVSLFVPKIKELDSGIRVTAEGTALAIEEYSKLETSRLFGLIKSVKTTYSALEDSPVLDAVSSVQDGVLEAARVFGYGADIFDDFSHQFKVSLKGLSEDEALAAIQAELLAMGDSMAALVPNFADMTSLIDAANTAISETYALGSTRLEAELLAAARRRGEVTIDRAADGLNTPETLLRLNSVDESTTEQTAILTQLLRTLEGGFYNGFPSEA